MAGYTGYRRYEPNVEFDRLKRDLKAGTPRRVYAFYGRERYLLDFYVRELRRAVPEGTEEFNHHRLEGKGLTARELTEAIDALPVFSERTLVEVSDFDIYGAGADMKRELLDILSDVPEYTCVVFIYDTLEFTKPDGKDETGKKLREHVTEVEFEIQEEPELKRWLSRNFAAAGKRIAPEAAARLVEMTCGQMTVMKAEIEKLTAYVRSGTVEVRDVEAVVTPIPEAMTWELTDALLAGRRDAAAEILSQLFQMDEDPQRISNAIVTKLRQLLVAKICLEGKLTAKETGGEIAKYSGTRPSEKQVKKIMDSAGRKSLGLCARLARAGVEAALSMNLSVSDEGRREAGRARVRELMTRVLVMSEGIE